MSLAASPFDPLAARRLRIAIGDGEMAILRFGAAGAPPMLFAHANGFCASSYRQMFEAMGDAFDIFAVDLRGFGATRLPADPGTQHGFDRFADDLRALLDAMAAKGLAKEKWVLAGHSLGAASVTLAAAGRDDVAELRLIEPVALPPRLAFVTKTPLWPILAERWPLVRGARGRRAVFPDRATVVEGYAKKPLFKPFAPGVLEDYLTDGLMPHKDGVRLAAAPAWEAACFAGQRHDFWRAIRKRPCPATALAIEHPSSTVPPASRARLEKLGVRVRAMAGPTHLAPFEDPRAAAEFLFAG